ncbi:MAG: S8 family serine peptidase [Acidobacteria bacterium]|nr:S8 family serine peptidase [Acidobacteriota bacterium]
MKKTLFLLTILLTLAWFQVFAPAFAQSGATARNFIEGQLLVKFQDGPYAPQTQAAHTQTGARVLTNFDSIGWQLVQLPADLSVEEGVAQYRKLRDCVLAQPNFTYHIFDTFPNDPQYGSMYGMTKIHMPTAWDTTTGNAAVVVADIDTGVDYNHQDLAANMWHNPGEIPNNGIDDDGNGFVDDYYGYDFINHDANPLDDNNHGTHTTGTIGAVGNNSLGVVGVNWNVKLMALKTHASDGNSTAATVIAAFNYVTMMKNRGINIRVTSNSWGGAPEAGSYDQALKDAIDAAGNAGVLNVFAAGNDNRDIDVNPSYPASYNSPSIIAVASSTSTDTRSGFSNWGATSVDVAAPGSSIISTFPNNTYATISGTSMATPHVAGAAALLVGLNPNLSPASLKASLINTVDPLAAFAGLLVSGGRINVANALANQTVCSFALNQTSQAFAAAGGNGAVNVTTTSACSWGVFSNASWISVTSAAGASGNGTASFTVAANPAGARSGTLNIGGQTFTVNQAGAVSCTYSITPTSQNIVAAGGSGSVNVTTQAGCTWTAISNVGWITVTSGASGTGNGTVNYAVAANPSTSARSGTVTIAGQTFTVNQDGAQPACSYALSPTSQAFAAGGGSSSVAVTSPVGCNWTATSNDGWISITSGASGTGNGTVNYAVANNPNANTRSGTMTIAGQTFTVTQAASSCVTLLTPASASFPISGGTLTVRVDAPINCAWSTTNVPGWVTITANGSSTGTKKLNYTVQANAGAARSATIFIGGLPHTLNQAGAGTVCTYAIAPTNQSFAASSGLGNVNVTAPASCNWTAISNANWLTISAGASGTGNGTVNYAVTANASTSARSGTLTIAGQTFTVTQAAATPGCSYAISPTSQAFAASGGSNTVTVTADAGCNWTATSNVNWLTISVGASGTGNGTVNYAVTANASTNARSGTLTIAGQSFTVTQAAATLTCSYAISPTAKNVSFGAISGSVNVTATAGCPWTAVSNVNWLTISSGASGTGSGLVIYQVASNPNRASRSGTITVAGLSFTVNQAARP